MRGLVLTFSDAQGGLISGQDDKRYRLSSSEWRGAIPPREGDSVDFVPDGDYARDVYSLAVAATRLSWSKLWFSLRGRATRFDYWVRYMLVYFCISIAARVMDFALTTGHGLYRFALFSPIVWLVMLWPSVAVGVKRCHDRNRSGWFLLWYLLPFVVVSAAVGMAFLLDRTGLHLASSSLSLFHWAVVAAFIPCFGIWIWMFIELACRRGTLGPNAYGPDPIGRD